MRWPRLTAEVLPLLTIISPLIGLTTTLVMSRWNQLLVRPMALSNSAMTLLFAAATLWFHSLPESAPLEQGRIHERPGIAWLAERGVAPADTKLAMITGMHVRLEFQSDGFSAWTSLLLSLVVWSILCLPGGFKGASFSSGSALLMISQALLLASCFSTDALTALVLMEISILPVAALVAQFGDDGRRSAAGSCWMWQMTGCSLSLLGITLLGVSQPWMQSDLVPTRGAALFEMAQLTTSVRQLLARSETAWQLWSFLAPWSASLLLLGFLIRLPTFPFMGWYQSILISAPAEISALIAAIFPLTAFSGWVRLGMPLFSDDRIVASILGAASLLGLLQAVFSLQSETDMKRFLANFSSAMLCLAGLGLCFQSQDAVRGAWFLILNQGLTVACGMLIVQMLDSRRLPRDLAQWSNARSSSTSMKRVVVILLATGLGVPALGGLAGMILQLSAASGIAMGMIAGLSIALLAMSTAVLKLVALVLSSSKTPTATSPVRSGESHRMDLGVVELAAFLPLLLVLIALNLAPTLMTRTCDSAIQRLFRHSDQRTLSGTSGRHSLPHLPTAVAAFAVTEENRSGFCQSPCKVSLDPLE
jgi:NADH-quinone oxidoreductase subunit M